MPKRPPSLSSFSLSAYGVGRPARRRIAVVACAVAVLLAVAAAVALLTGGENDRRPSDTAAPAAPAPPASGTNPPPSAGSGTVPKPARISDPVAYARAAAQMLWSYDTRGTSRDQQLTGMRAWMTPETRYADWPSVSGQVPDPVLWSRMADQDQHAAAHITEGHYPSAFKQALADDPSAITEAYIYVVTVTGTQHITWAKGGGGAEDRAVTLAVQCRPGHDCTLAAIAPSVTQ
ncbi:hypothetical protein [Streptomyces acidiscabies]|uniref:Uncharacterized protein n=1 Tax=Streptomyces acidiscabies TaxID=42234 RepID=A0AAP6BJ07_9ACTN|nr:hypothetical protein [Streptomyces acidiscabies]MBP5935410.1 hypothetical protein [Streptomyces sp. LBUM 1476]MBZ3916737.1 hypothetical protein [Streptomyces acidiscabies]MDX2965625.1 hypothetical protein [Streptomyces acidiscabies]MDX3024873.1 hypothetical protein [Streptomyces acidiscabies]MDX3795541.1 hypothetical protein [Streptomyces acidiscabies]